VTLVLAEKFVADTLEDGILEASGSTADLVVEVSALSGGEDVSNEWSRAVIQRNCHILKTPKN
jgi:hypothetical protein